MAIPIPTEHSLNIRNCCFLHRGDRDSLGHGVQWDNPYIVNSKKENAIMALSNKCQRYPPSCQEGIFTAVNLV